MTRGGLALPRGDWPLLAAAAVLLVLAYPPFHLLVPSFTCAIPVVFLLRRAAADPRPLRRRLVQGFWYGFLSQALVLYWIAIALWRFSHLSVAGWAATVLALGLFNALAFALTGWVTDRTRIPLIGVLPVFWTLLDLMLEHLGDVSFPWLGLGTSLTGFPTLVQIADTVGARGITFLLVVANVALATAWLERRERRAALRVAGVGAGVLAGLAYGTWRERTLPLRRLGTVALVQPAVPFGGARERENRRPIFEGLLALTREAFAKGNPDFVAWPEAAVPQYFPNGPWEAEIADLARAHRTPILVGGLDLQWLDPAAQRYDYWNAAFLFDSTGSRAPYPVYHKRYLVPITERVPFVPKGWVRLPFFGSFSAGAPGGVYQIGMGRFGVAICYESVFENLWRRYRRMGADFVVNATNDAWFGETSAPRQHLAHLVMRAIENRVGVARPANTGISATVDPLGRIHDGTRLGDRLVVLAELEGSSARAPYTTLGDWIGTLVLLLAAGQVGAALWIRRPGA